MLYACIIHAESIFRTDLIVYFYISFPLGAVLFPLIKCRDSVEAAEMVDLVPELDKRATKAPFRMALEGIDSIKDIAPARRLRVSVDWIDFD